MLFNRKEHNIFFDFGHRFSKMAYIIKQNQMVTLDKYIVHPTPDDLFKDVIPQNPLIFKELVHELLNQVPEPIQKQCRIHLTAPDSHSILKKINLPQQLPKNLDQHMLYEAEQISTYPIEDALIDYDPLHHDSFFQTSENEVPIIVTIAKKSHVQPFMRHFEDIEIPLDSATPASVGLMNVGLYLLRKHIIPDRLLMAHMGDEATLLLYLSRQAIRFCFHPKGFAHIIQETIQHCDLAFTEGRYLAEHLNNKDVPDIFMSAFNNSLSRYAESLGDQMLSLSDTPSKDKMTVLLSGGPTLCVDLTKCYKRFPELDVQILDFQTHLSRKQLILEENIDMNKLTTFSPHFIGYMESMGS